MLITTGKVRQGVIAVDSTLFAEGATVTLLASNGEETFMLDEQEEAAILSAMEEAKRGETLSAAEVLDKLMNQ